MVPLQVEAEKTRRIPCRKGIELLSRLEAAETQIPNNIPLATPAHRLSLFLADPRSCVTNLEQLEGTEVEVKDDWLTLNSMLKSTFGWGESEMWENCGLEGAMIEPKIKGLLCEIDSQPAKPFKVAYFYLVKYKVVPLHVPTICAHTCITTPHTATVAAHIPIVAVHVTTTCIAIAVLAIPAAIPAAVPVPIPVPVPTAYAICHCPIIIVVIIDTTTPRPLLRLLTWSLWSSSSWLSLQRRRHHCHWHVVAQLHCTTCTVSKSMGLERRESVKTQFGGAQVSLGLPGTEDNSKKARLKHKGCLHGANIWRESDTIVQEGRQREQSYMVQGNSVGRRVPQKWSAGETERKAGHPIAKA
ncbi:hypothetical protein EDB86DRAFT_2835557 [Lactarius hatsudake]|nr:hypothetical protein EDB86DRAFT_2835557 [Lactarius hatsudake]